VPAQAVAVRDSKRLAVEDVLYRIEQDTQRLPREALGEFLPLLRKARDEAAAGMREWLETHLENGAERYTAQKYRSVMAQLDSAMQAVADLEGPFGNILIKTGQDAYSMAGDHLIRQLGEYSEIFRDSITPLPLQEAMYLIEKDGGNALIRRMRTSAHRYVGDVQRGIRQQIAIGLVKGETVFQMTERLVRHGGPRGWVATRGVLGEPGAVAEYFADGLFKSKPYWAERVVRTEVMDAYGASAADNLGRVSEVIPEVLKRWTASGQDKRMCVICRELDGKVAKPNEEFPGGYERSPAHPNCMCVVGPWLPDMN
jgi:hypothetical protein